MTVSESNLIASVFVRADFVFQLKNVQNAKYVRGAFESLATAKRFEQILNCASTQPTFVPITHFSFALQRVAQHEFSAVSMSSQSTTTRLPRKASTHDSGYYSQVANVDDDDVPARDADDDADDAAGKSKRRTKPKAMQLDPAHQVCEFCGDFKSAADDNHRSRARRR